MFRNGSKWLLSASKFYYVSGRQPRKSAQVICQLCGLHSDAGASGGHASRIDSDQSYYYEKEDGEHMESDETLDIKDKILKSALQFVPKHGWSKAAIIAGANEEGLPATSHGMFQRGSGDLVLFFYAAANADLSQQMEAHVQRVVKGELERKRVSEFVRDAVEIRLRMLLPYIDSWPQAMAQLVLPQNAPDALRNLGTLVDDIWYHAGDRSTDFNWYTKRATLAALYKSTELHLLQDSSADSMNTWEFLDRRIANLTTFGKLNSQIQQSAEQIEDLILGTWIMGRNVLGMNSRKR